jgi:cell shape-determining protein MreC
MRRSPSATFTAILTVGVALIGLAASNATAQSMAKAQVGSLITRVENNVDEFRNYLEKRGDNASDAKSTAQASGRRKGATENQKAKANTKKDALDDALVDLNQSTNRLRRKFDATDKWIETKVQVEKVVDDARKINQVVARGNYGAEAARLWAALRTGINDLARAYGVQPLAV